MAWHLSRVLDFNASNTLRGLEADENDLLDHRVLALVPTHGRSSRTRFHLFLRCGEPLRTATHTSYVTVRVMYVCTVVVP